MTDTEFGLCAGIYTPMS